MKVSRCLDRLCRLPARRLGRTAIAWQCGAILLATGPMSAFGAETTPLGVSVSAQSVESGLAGNMSGLEASSRKRDPNKLGLPEMLTIVRATHPAVTSRQADVDATESSLLGAKLRFLPAPSFDRTDLSGQSASTVRLEQPLWTGGRLMAGLDGADAKAKISSAGLSETQLNLSLRTTTHYQSFVALTGRLGVVNDGLQRLTELRQMIENRSMAGTSAVQDVDLARSRIAQMQSDRAAILASRQSVLAQLSQLLGRRVSESDIDPTPAPLPSIDLASVENRALQTSPTVLKSRLNIDSASADEKYAQSAFWPTVSFRAEYQDGQYAGSLQPGSRWYMVVNYVPGAGLSSIADVAAAKARIRVAESDLETTGRDVLDKVQTEMDDYESARVRLPDLMRATQLSIGQIESSKRLFVLGRRSWLDLLNSVRELVIVHQQEVEAKALLMGSYYRLGLLAGDLYPSESSAR